MTQKSMVREPALPALLITPDRELASAAQKAFTEARAFEVVSELRAYPPSQTLEIRVRQAQPDVVLVDLSSDMEAAKSVIRSLAAMRPPVPAIGISPVNNSDLLLEGLRAGAGDFLYPPFESEAQREAAVRIRRLRQLEEPQQQEHGQIIAFSSIKPGSGASTLAMQSAFALRRLTGKRILLADFDLISGSVAFSLKVSPAYSILDALAQSDRLDPAIWSSLVSNCHGVDVLAAPDSPTTDLPESSRVHDVIEYARMLYDWVLIDLPTAFHQLSLFMMSEADQVYLVSTSELASLHLGRRASGLLSQLGFERDRVRMVVNRLSKREEIATTDMEKIFTCPIYSSFPNDYFALHKVVTRAEPLGPESDLGKAMEKFGAKAAGLATSVKKGGRSLLGSKPALSEL
jgi:pilus assembly protein CpaE